MHEDDFLSCSYEDWMNSLLTIYHYADLSLQICRFISTEKPSAGFVFTWSKFDEISYLKYNNIPPSNESRSNL